MEGAYSFFLWFPFALPFIMAVARRPLDVSESSSADAQVVISRLGVGGRAAVEE